MRYYPSPAREPGGTGEEVVLPAVGPAVLVLLLAEVLPVLPACDPVLVPVHLVHLVYLVPVHLVHPAYLVPAASIAASSVDPESVCS